MGYLVGYQIVVHCLLLVIRLSMSPQEIHSIFSTAYPWRSGGLPCRFGVGAKKTAYPGECKFKFAQAEVQRLAATHGKTSNARASRSVFHREFFFHIGNQVIE
jgi:hypothetical protein